jgi:tetratricopeptide (TPR) repeat protein
MSDAESTALYLRGNQLWDRGDLPGAEEAWRAASQRSCHPAALNLGTLLYTKRAWTAAADEWQFAAGADDPAIAVRAVTNYGRLISETEFSHETSVGSHRYAKSLGRSVADADRIWRSAAESGDPEAAWAYIGLGRLYDPTELAEEPDAVRAEQAFEDAAASGHADAAPCALYKLGRLREQLSRQAEGTASEMTIKTLRRGFASRHHEWAPRCANQLAHIYADAGEIAEAERWWRAVVESGHPEVAAGAQRALTPQLRLEDEADLVFDLPCDDAEALERFDAAMVQLRWHGDVEAAGTYDYRAQELGPHRLSCVSKGGLLSSGNRMLVLVKQVTSTQTRVGLANGTSRGRQRLKAALQSGGARSTF